MRYLLLIYEPEYDAASVSEEEWTRAFNEYNAFTEEVRSRGLMLGGEALQPTSTATTVRVRDGKTVTTDGPFAETREVLGGYYLLDCRDLDEAIEMAAKIPGARAGPIEVRPIMEIPGATHSSDTAPNG